MIGKLGGSTGISEHSGLTPRVATLLFDVARSAPKMHEFLVEASFLEIYNEKVNIKDLIFTYIYILHIYVYLLFT